MARTRPRKPSTSRELDDFAEELRHAGNRADLVRRIGRLWQTLNQLTLDAEDHRLIELGRAEKKNFAQRLSTAIAQKVADALRPRFPEVVPNALGQGHESPSASATGLKKLDVNYSTSRSGLELAVSIKTINFKDEETGRYTKNTKRVDGELRAEAQDCHTRQPYAVLAGYVFLPWDASEDGKTCVSSFKHNADVFHRRCGRRATSNEHSLFEALFLGLYKDDGFVRFFRATDDLPRNGLPRERLTLSQTLVEIRDVHARRNRRR